MKKYNEYLYTYRYNNCDWRLNITAESRTDAEWYKTPGLSGIRAQGIQHTYKIEKIKRAYQIRGIMYLAYSLKSAKAICQLLENNTRGEMPHV